MDGRSKQKTMVFLIGQAISLFGSTLVQMAVVWYVTLHTGEGAWVAAFTAASYLPQFFISFVGGVWADRLPRKALILAADAATALVTLGMWCLLPHLGSDTQMLALLLVMSALRALFAGIQTPAVNAVLPQLVPEAQLMRYNGINATVQSVMQFAAPAAAGLLLSTATLREVLLVDVATAAVGMGLLCLIRLPAQIPQTGGSVLSDMKSGLAYTLSHRFLKYLLGVYALFLLLSVPAGYLAQLYVSRTFGEAYWYLTAVEVVGFLGMMAGGVVMSTWGGFSDRTATLALGLGAFGLLASGMALAPRFWLYLLLMVFYGIALTIVQTAVTTTIGERTEPQLQGRVFGLLSTAYAGCLPLGMAVFGPLADAVSLKLLMLLTGAMTALLGLAIAAYRLCRGRRRAR